MSLQISLKIVKAVDIHFAHKPISVKVSLEETPGDPQTTSVVSSLSPNFDSAMVFVSEHPTSENLIFELLSGDPPQKRIGRRLGVPVRDLPFSSGVQPRVWKITHKGKPLAGLSCEVEANPVELPQPEPQLTSASFSWGSYGSQYAMSASLYSDSGGPMSDLRDDEVERHAHSHAPRPAVRRIGALETLAVEVIGAAGIPICASYATAEIGGRGQRATSELAPKPAKPVYGLAVDFGEVKPWEIVELAVWRLDPAQGHVRIGAALVTVKDIELDSEDVVALELMVAHEARSAGQLFVRFAHRAEELAEQ
jgi:hypothetical protein